jgi:hypothetical protein
MPFGKKFLMKKAIKLPELAALASIIALTFIACLPDDPGPGETESTLTVTKFQAAAGPGVQVSGNAYFNSSSSLDPPDLTFRWMQLNGSTATFDVYQEENGEMTPFTGNETIPKGKLYIDSWGEDASAHYTSTVPVTFTNGSASVNFSSQTELWSEKERVGTLTVFNFSVVPGPGEEVSGKAYFDSRQIVDPPDLTFRRIQLDGSTAAFEVWHEKHNKPALPETVTVPVSHLSIHRESENVYNRCTYGNTEPVAFTKGSATVDFNDFENNAIPGSGSGGMGNPGDLIITY